MRLAALFARTRALLRVALCGAALGGPLAAAAEPMILAAASTGRAIDAALAESTLEAATSYGASGILARQIEQGAPADLFISANPKWMQHLVETGFVDAAAVTVLMSNRLVLIAPEPAPPLALESLAQRIEGGLFAMADPETAPVGAYGKAALETLGAWETVAPALVPMRNTLATVAAVAAGEADLGLVYASDASGVPGVAVVYAVPATAHPPIRYLMAPLAQGDDAAGAAQVIDYLLSAEGRAVLSEFGFLVVAEGD
ncbi:MAG: molybdate ABC transporter substrate-binding protein [Pseudomonadota bacterium]